MSMSAEALLRQAGQVLGHVPARQDAGVDRRVERLELATQRLARTGQLGDGPRLDAGLSRQQRARRLRGDDLDPEVQQLTGQVGDAGAVRDREQGSHSVLSSLVDPPAPSYGAGTPSISTLTRGTRTRLPV